MSRLHIALLPPRRRFPRVAFRCSAPRPRRKVRHLLGCAELGGSEAVAAPASGESRGQAIVEFALVVSVLFLILFGIVDFSRLFFAYATMANGVREGARFASAQPASEAAILEQAYAMMVLIGDEATVTVSFPDSDEHGNSHCSHYCRVVVRATCDFDVWTPIIPHIEIVAQSTMHVE